MKTILILFGLLLSTTLLAETPFRLERLTPAQKVSFQKVIATFPEGLLSQFEFSVKIKVNLAGRPEGKTMRLGWYNDITKSIVINDFVFEDEKLLRQALIHEMAHAYEYNVQKIYKIPEYQLAAGLHKRGFLFAKFIRRRNYLESSSVDPYEFKNARESFPVNFEAFMMDPEFQCRKPLVNFFIEKHFKFAAFPKQACKMVRKVPVTINNHLHYLDMDFSRLYQVHHLYATKGELAMSRWGHSMVRMVFCAPDKKVMDESCVKDVAHHWVISFRANVQDIQINNIKGILGKYPSEIFIFPMVEIIKEYNKTELRDLISVPMRTNADQLERFKQLVLDTSYAYQGRYRFFTVNCATETLNFLQIALNDEDFYSMTSMSPKGLQNKLMNSDLVNVSKLQDQNAAIASGHFFKGQDDILEKSFSKVSQLVDEGSLKKFVKKTSAADRKFYFESKEISTNVWASIILLEKHIMDKFQKKFMEKVAKLVVDTLDNRDVPTGVDYLETLRKNIINNNTIKYDWKGYGIPFEREFSEPKPADLDLPQNAAEEAQNWIREHFPREQKELDMITDNINNFTNKMKETIRRSK